MWKMLGEGECYRNVNNSKEYFSNSNKIKISSMKNKEIQKLTLDILMIEVYQVKKKWLA